jgi:hypothetical protein
MSARVLVVSISLITSAALVGCGGGSSSASGSSAANGTDATTATSMTATSMSATSTSATSTTATSSTTVPTAAPLSEVNDPGDIPDNQVFVPYTSPDHLYVVKVPEGWARSTAGGTTSFTDKFNTIQLEVVPMPAAPTVQSVKTVEVPTLAASTQGFVAGDVSQVTRKAGPAILATYTADSPPNAVTSKVVKLAVERYELWKDGKTVVITVSGAVGADNVDPWRIVTDSFTWSQ